MKREFMEEALDSTGAAKVTICMWLAIQLLTLQENVENLTAMVDKFFEGGEEVYRYKILHLDLPSIYIFEMISNIRIRGYVDDPRNTDNAWMETVAFNFHDPSGQEVCIKPVPK